mmetsp:Transcript_109467/g.349303  ORF Transcript_109467/g.349303 Transcript_109467/m.349303 type:complete len:308 (-) Transcript_109467:102-1025(-)
MRTVKCRPVHPAGSPEGGDRPRPLHLGLRCTESPSRGGCRGGALHLAAVLPVDPGSASENVADFLAQLAVRVAGFPDLLPESHKLFSRDCITSIDVDLVEHGLDAQASECPLLPEELEGLRLGDLPVSVQVHHIEELLDLGPGFPGHSSPPGTNAAETAVARRSVSALRLFDHLRVSVLLLGHLRKPAVGCSLNSLAPLALATGSMSQSPLDAGKFDLLLRLLLHLLVHLLVLLLLLHPDHLLSGSLGVWEGHLQLLAMAASIAKALLRFEDLTRPWACFRGRTLKSPAKQRLAVGLWLLRCGRPIG